MTSLISGRARPTTLYSRGQAASPGPSVHNLPQRQRRAAPPPLLLLLLRNLTRIDYAREIYPSDEDTCATPGQGRISLAQCLPLDSGTSVRGHKGPDCGSVYEVAVRRSVGWSGGNGHLSGSKNDGWFMWVGRLSSGGVEVRSFLDALSGLLFIFSVNSLYLSGGRGGGKDRRRLT